VKRLSIEKLKQIKKVIQICDAKYVYDYKLQFMTYIIMTLQDQENEITELKSKVDKLEKTQTYYPMTEEEIRNIKVGGTD